MAAREQIQGQQAPALQTQAAPIFTPAMPASNTSWRDLADVFARGEVMARQEKERQDKEDELAATRWANSHTVDELEKAIRDGDLARDRSPVFAATAQNIWGVNAQARMQRDVASKMASGELKFKDDAELDAYMTEQRNTLLAGHSNYAAAGFDRGYGQTRQAMQQAMAKQRDQQALGFATTQARDLMNNALIDVTGPGFAGTPQEAAKQLMGTYETLDKTLVLPPDQLKATFQETLARAADTGKTELVTALLDSDLPGGKGTLRATIGDLDALRLEGKAKAKHDQLQGEAVHEGVKPYYQQSREGELNETEFRQWAAQPANAKHLSGAQIEAIVAANREAIASKQREALKAQNLAASQASISAAQQAVDAALDRGVVFQLEGQHIPVMTPEGKVHDFNWKEYAEASLQKQTEGLPLETQAAKWAYNSALDNPQWKSLLAAGMTNISSIGVAANGKPAGTLNDTATQALELFRQLNHAQPAYAKKLVGEATYEKYTDMALMVDKFGKSPDEAAMLLAEADKAMVPGGAAKVKDAEIQAEAHKLTTGPWYKPDWLAHAMGDSTAGNSIGVAGAIGRYASILARTGMYPDAKTALATSAEYFANPAVSVLVNGTRYLRSDLPTPPGPGKSQEDWFGQWMDAVPKKAAKGMGFKENEVRVEYSEAARGYTAFVNNMPLVDDKTGHVVVYTQEQVRGWMTGERQREIDGIVTEYQKSKEERAGKVFQGTPNPMSRRGREAAKKATP